MKQLQRRFHQTPLPNFPTFRIIVPLLVANALTIGQARAQEVAPPPVETPPISQPATGNAENPSLVASGTSADEIQGRLNNLEQRLNKVSATELDPITLVLPNISSNVPNAYGASKGMGAIGVGFQNRTRFSNDADGTAAALIGLGDPRKVGADLQVSFLDLSRFGHRLALGFKLHRQLANDTTVAVGGENALLSSFSDSDASYYGVISKKLRLTESSRKPFSRVYLSLGVGTGRFLSERDVFNNKGSVNVFGSAAINVNRSTTVFSEWTGQSLDVGTSVVPIRKYPFVITLALADVAGSGGDGTRFTAGFGYVFSH